MSMMKIMSNFYSTLRSIFYEKIIVYNRFKKQLSCLRIYIILKNLFLFKFFKALLYSSMLIKSIKNFFILWLQPITILIVFFFFNQITESWVWPLILFLWASFIDIILIIIKAAKVLRFFFHSILYLSNSILTYFWLISYKSWHECTILINAIIIN